MQDLIDLYAVYGFHPAAGSTQMVRRGHAVLSKSGFRRGLDVMSLRFKRMWRSVLRVFGVRG